MAAQQQPVGLKSSSQHWRVAEKVQPIPPNLGAAAQTGNVFWYQRAVIFRHGYRGLKQGLLGWGRLLTGLG